MTDITQDSEHAIAAIAREIELLSEGIRELRAGRLTDSALVLLIQNACPSQGRPSQRQIREILNVIENLDDYYLKKIEEG